MKTWMRDAKPIFKPITALETSSMLAEFQILLTPLSQGSVKARSHCHPTSSSIIPKWWLHTTVFKHSKELCTTVLVLSKRWPGTAVFKHFSHKENSVLLSSSSSVKVVTQHRCLQALQSQRELRTTVFKQFSQWWPSTAVFKQVSHKASTQHRSLPALYSHKAMSRHRCHQVVQSVIWHCCLEAVVTKAGLNTAFFSLQASSQSDD